MIKKNSGQGMNLVVSAAEWYRPLVFSSLNGFLSFLFGEVSSSSGCLGWAALFYCGTPCALHIIIFHLTTVALRLALSTCETNQILYADDQATRL